VHYHYQQKIGTEALAELESQLRRAVGRLQLDYLPDSWTEGS
jgi:hypothetical protein